MDHGNLEVDLAAEDHGNPEVVSAVAHGNLVEVLEADGLLDMEAVVVVVADKP